MAGSDKKPRLFRRIFKLPDLSKEPSSNQEGQKNFETSTERKPSEIANFPNSTVEGDGKSVGDDSTCLWDEVYDSFISTATPELQALAKSLRDQCIQPETLATSCHGRDAGVSPRWQLCSEVLRMTESQKDDTEKGDVTALGMRIQRAYRGIVVWTQKFVALGDVLSQVDPVHIGIPWAAVRAVLIVASHGHNTQAELVENIANLSELISRYAVFEQVYLQDQGLLSETLKDKLTAALEALYMAALKYCLEVIEYSKRSFAAQSFSSISLCEPLRDRYKHVLKCDEVLLRYESMMIKDASYSQYLNIRSILSQYDDHMQSQQRAQISDWISQIDYYSQYREMRTRLLLGTGQWFLDRAEYIEWTQSSQSSLLWLRGNAGTGKTSLLSCVIEKLVQAPGLDSTEVSAYFYCSRTSNDSRLQDQKSILLSLLRQLAAPLPGLAIKAPILSVYSREMSMGSHKADLEDEEIISLLTDLIKQHYKKVILVLDALDECEPRGRLQLLETLTKLTYINSTTIVKTLISSRQDPDIEDHFMKTPNVWITATDNAADISEYVSKELGKRLLRGKAPRDLQDRVEKELNAKANGVFRWVTLQVDALCDPDRVYSEEDVEYLLPRLPETLEDTYSKILSDTERLLPHGRLMLSSIIKFLICAIYPMTYEEINEAVHILIGVQVPPTTRKFVRSALKMGRGLIVAGDGGTGFVFAHLSVKEFFESRPNFSGDYAHALAAEACLSLYFGTDFEERPMLPLRGFRSYAVQHLGKHCQKAGALRSSPKLHSLMHNFLLQEGSNNAYELWNHDTFSANTRLVQDLERRQCHSEPALPLFMACVYDFEEYVEALILRKEEMLHYENFYGNTPLEVATMYGFHNIVKKLYNSASLAPKSPIRAEKWIQVAAQCKDLNTWTFVFDNTPCETSKTAIRFVAANATHGFAMMPSILSTMAKLDTRTLKGILQSCASHTILHMALNHPARAEITISVLEAAVQNPYINPHLTKLILSKALPYLRVTNQCIALAIRNNERHAGVIMTLLNHHSRPEMAEEIICEVIKQNNEDDPRYLDQLIQQNIFSYITDDMLAAALVAHQRGRTVVPDYVLDHSKVARFSQQIVQRVISFPLDYRNPPSRPILTRPKCPPISEECLFALSEMRYSGEDGSITMEQCRLTELTDAYIQNCVAKRSARETAYVCYSPRAIPLSESAIYASMKNSRHGSRILRFLLQYKPGFRMAVSEDVLVQALSLDCAYDFVLMLADHWGTLPVTKRSVVAAVKKAFHSKDLVHLLLEHTTSGAILFDDDVLNAAIFSDNLGFVQDFMLHKPEFEIKEEHLKVAINSWNPRMGLLRLLLSQKIKPVISISLLETAACMGNQKFLELLMEQEGAPQPLPDLTYLAPRPLPNLTYLLQQKLSQPTDHQTITFDDILSAASKEGMPIRDCELSTTKLDELLSRYDGPPIDTSRLIEVAAERDDGKFVVQYILARYPETTITQRALLAAAQNEFALTTLFELLLNHFYAEVSASLLKQAVGNKYHGTVMLEFLLSKYPDVGDLGSDVIVAALKNPYCGRSIFQIIVRRHPQLAITQSLIDAASENMVMSGLLLQMLLKHALESPIISSVDLIYQKLEGIQNGVRDSLFMAACYGDEVVLRYLLSRGVALNTAAEELGTALNVAIFSNQTKIVEILLEHGSDPNSYSFLYGTALRTACFKNNSAIVRGLALHGANMDAFNEFGRTVLHLIARYGNPGVVKTLIAHKASITQKDYQGMTPLHHAAACFEVSNGLDLLIKSEASLIDEGDSAQWTPLHWAAYANSASAVSRLVEAGASKRKRTACGKTPLQIAMFRGHFHLRPKLLLPDTEGKDKQCVGEHHDGVCCYVCGLDIQGTRYKCTSCKDSSLCFRCIVDAKRIHDPDHEFDAIEP